MNISLDAFKKPSRENWIKSEKAI